MFNMIKKLFAKTNNKTIVVNAVKKNWITPAQYELITGEVYA